MSPGVESPVPLPWLVRALDGTAEVDVVPIQRVEASPDGVRMAGRGACFEAEAAWTAGGAGWDVVLEVRLHAERPLAAGLVVAARLEAVDDPHWLIPGLFYNANRAPESRAPCPRWATDGADAWTAPSWSFRSDRAATPLVFGREGQRGVGLSTTETSPLGLTGLGFGIEGGIPELRLCFPYREEPLAYDGSAAPRPADLPTHEWHPGSTVRLEFRVDVTSPEPYEWVPVLRRLHARAAATNPLAPWVSAAEAACLAAEGLVRWHYRPDTRVLIETAAFARHGDGSGVEDGDRMAMHVAWVSGAPTATALLAHGRRTGDAAATGAGRAVLEYIAANLAPCGTFWGQWTADRGWTKGWTPGDDALHARTLGEATLFLARAAAATPDAPPAWRDAVASNLEFVVSRQRDDGAMPAAWNGRTGEAQSWHGTAGLAWVPALIEGARLLGRDDLLEPARRAGRYYARFVEDEFLFGAPEDVDLGPTSEDGYAALMAYVALAEADRGEPRWLDLAVKSAEWALTFRYTYNVAFDPATTLGHHDFRSRGADQASPANQHLHAYGLVCLPELVRLGRLTGDAHYALRAREHLAAFRQFIARHDGDFGARRGMAAERYYQTACFGPKGEIGPLSHAWCLGLLLWACDAAADLPELAEDAG